MATQTRQRPDSSGARKSAAAHTGLNARKPQATPPSQGRSRTTRSQPSIASARLRGEFCASPSAPL